ncbi:MAG: DegV family protein, partial [Anaerolineae bacterium]
AQESPVPVEVVDSETTAMAQGFVVLEAARAALEGGTLSEVVERARSMVPHVEVVALLESIEYAFRGGRLASGARLLGALLRIQPLVKVSENKVSLVGQVRRRRSGITNLVERVTSRVEDRPTHLTVHYAEDKEEGKRLLDTLREKVNCVEHYLIHIPVALGVHAGPGSIGVAYYVEGGPVEQESLVDRLRTRLPGGD